MIRISRHLPLMSAGGGHDIYRLVLLERGWTVAAWQSWLVDNLERELVDGTDSRPRHARHGDAVERKARSGKGGGAAGELQAEERL